MARRIACVGAVVRSGGKLLVIRRGRPPGAGLWSLPGGRVEPGESDEQALRREVREETGLEVSVGELVGTVERDADPDLPGSGGTFVIHDYACSPAGVHQHAVHPHAVRQHAEHPDGRTCADPPTGPTLRAGDDAAEARWVTDEELRALPTTPGLIETLVSWRVVRENGRTDNP
jgi:8-oxo-dGTP diphosphatase